MKLQFYVNTPIRNNSTCIWLLNNNCKSLLGWWRNPSLVIGTLCVYEWYDMYVIKVWRMDSRIINLSFGICNLADLFHYLINIWTWSKFGSNYIIPIIHVLLFMCGLYNSRKWYQQNKQIYYRTLQSWWKSILLQNNAKLVFCLLSNWPRWIWI